MSGYSKTPLWKKLGYKSGHQALLIHPPKDYFDLVSPLPDTVSFDGTELFDIVHIFTNEVEQMENELLLNKKRIVQNGMIWVSWYKKASKKPTELNEDIIRNTALAMKLVDVKVCSVTDDWSALKLVIPLKYRQ